MSRIKAIVLLLLLSWFCVSPVHGWCMTTTATSQSITIPIQQWQSLKNEFSLLNQDLAQCKTELTRLKKPSNQLVDELAQAQASLLKLQKELDEQKNDLTLLSQEVTELKELSEKLKSQIDKERRIHKRQIWQNRLWCIIGGTAVGFAIGHANK